MTWLVLIALASAFAAGWAGGVWQCSRRRDCPRYTAYALKKWKHEISAKVNQHGQMYRPSLTPPEGTKP